MLFVLLFFVKLSTSFRMENDLFHIEATTRFCGCEEQKTLDELKNKEWKPEDFVTQHGKIWLGGIKADEEENCAKMCILVNQRTTHFTFEGMYNFLKC